MTKNEIQRSLLAVMFLAGMAGVAPAEDQKPFTYNDHSRRDPLWPLITSTGATVNYDSEYSPTDLVLEGIISDAAGRNMAIINGRIVRTNDQVGRYTITRIDKDSIILKRDQQSFEVRLKKEE